MIRPAVAKKDGPAPRKWTAKPAEGSWRSHQVPFSDMNREIGHLKLLEQWMKSYKAEETIRQ